MPALDGATAVVTGGAGGIGRAIATRLGREGAHVVVVDIADGTDSVEAVEAAGGSAEFREADVTDEAALEAAFDGLALDVLVNNAGYYAPFAGEDGKQRFDAIDRDEWDHVLAVNATGPFLCAKAALGRFGTDGGAIVNMSSDSVNDGVPGFLHYVASKSALVGMTRSMAAELGDLGIRVNAVMPGLTATEATLAGGEAYVDRYVEGQALEGRIGPSGIADVVAFLCGPDSAVVTGQVMVANAGHSFY